MDKQAAFSSTEMMDWIREMASFGARRAGTPAGLANEDYLIAKLTEFGLGNIRKEPIPVECYRPKSRSLVVRCWPYVLRCPMDTVLPVHSLKGSNRARLCRP